MLPPELMVMPDHVSVILLQLGSVLMSMAQIASRGHVDI